MNRTLLQHPTFSRLFIAALVSEMGSKIHRVALLVLVYELTNNPVWVGISIAVQLVATVVVGPILAAWAEYQERRWLLVATDLALGLLVLSIPFIGPASLVALLAIAFGIQALNNLRALLIQTVIPEQVSVEQLDSANGLMTFTEQFAEVVFMGLAGLLVASVGTDLAFWIDSLTYLISGIILLTLPRMPAPPASAERYGTRIKEGLQEVLSNPTLRWLTALTFVGATFGAAEAVLGLVLAVDLLRVGPEGFGFMESALALGAILGTLVVAQLTARLPRTVLIPAGIALLGLFEASVGFMPVFLWVVVAYFCSGVVNMIFLIPSRSLLQIHTSEDRRTRTIAAYRAIIMTGIITGTLVSGAMASLVGVATVFLVAGGIICVVGLAGLLLRASAESAPRALMAASPEPLESASVDSPGTSTL